MDQKINGSKAKPGASFHRKFLAAAIAPVIVFGGVALPMAAAAAEPASAGIRALAPINGAPDAPQALDTAVRAETSTYAVDISWAAPVDTEAAAAVTGYRVDLVTNNSVNNQTATVDADTFGASFSGLAQRSGYFVRVTALTATGDGAATDTMFTTDAIVPQVSGIVATPVTVNGDTYFDISWNSAGDEYSYGIRVEDEYNNGYGGGTTYVNAGSPLTARVGGNLTSNREYRILVTTQTSPGGQAGYFSQPLEIRATSGWNALNPAQDLVASTPADGTFTVSWQPPLSNGTEVADYVVELMQEVDGVKVPVDNRTVAGLTTSFTSLPTGIYSARVIARTASAEVARSTPESANVAVTGAEIETAPVFASQPASQDTVVGEEVILTVTGEGLDSVDWQLYDADAEEWITVGEDAGATFRWIAPADAGTYSLRAVATNAAGSTISDTATVTVAEAPVGAPVFTKELDAATQLWANQPISLNVALEYDADTTFAWEFRTADGDWATIANQDSATLNLPEGLPVLYDGGQIRVAATNGSGTTYSTTTLTIAWQTMSPGVPQNLAAADGKLTWEAPAANNGPGVERYTVLVLQGQQEVATVEIPVDGPLEWAGLGELAPGDYLIYVIASNSFGSESSASFSYNTTESAEGGNGDPTGSGTGGAAPTGEDGDLARTGGEVATGIGFAAILAAIAGFGLFLFGRKRKSTV